MEIKFDQELTESIIREGLIACGFMPKKKLDEALINCHRVQCKVEGDKIGLTVTLPRFTEEKK